MAQKIFLSYRRDETEDITRSLLDRLVPAFGPSNVFHDIHTIDAGQNFRKEIDSAIERSRVLVAVIGQEWMKILHERMHSGSPDWVRYEIERAFGRNLAVIPVLVKGSRIPSESALPDGLKPLFTANALEILGGQHFNPDVDRLIAAIRKISDEHDLHWEQGEGRVRGRRAAIAALAAVGLLAYRREAWPIPKPDGRALGHLLYDTCWVTYDPPEMDLRPDRSPVFPDESSIVADLDAIRTAGFNGIVTSTANGIMDRVPRLAQSRKLRVMMGIWNPNESVEVLRAIRQEPFVDAYVVGHTGLPDRYSLGQLERAIDRVKRRTGKPAAVSELAIHYTPELAALGDWIYPDAHLTVRDGEENYRVDVDRDLDQFMEATRAVAPLARQLNRPFVFANVAYPHSGVPGASREHQAEFFRRLLERINDPGRGHAVKVAIVAQAAFDTPWKRGKPFHPWDPFAGLIDLEGSVPLSPAGRAILRWFPHLEAAIHGPSR